MKMDIAYKFIYRVKIIPIQFLMLYFTDLGKIIQEFLGNHKGCQKSKQS